MVLSGVNRHVRVLAATDRILATPRRPCPLPSPTYSRHLSASAVGALCRPTIRWRRDGFEGIDLGLALEATAGLAYRSPHRRGGAPRLRRLRGGPLAQAQGQILDLRAGTGANLRHYAREGVTELVLLEPAPAMLSRAGAKAHRLGIAVRPVLGEGRIPLPVLSQLLVGKAELSEAGRWKVGQATAGGKRRFGLRLPRARRRCRAEAPQVARRLPGPGPPPPLWLWAGRGGVWRTSGTPSAASPGPVGAVSAPTRRGD